jgi:DNA ligase-1
MRHASDTLDEIKLIKGTNAKKAILVRENENTLLKKILCYGFNPYIPFHVIKVPNVDTLERAASPHEEKSWETFFQVADKCAKREITGNNAINELYEVFKISTKKNESWMRKILNKHLSIGVSTKTINKVYPGLIPTFDVSLAQKFEEKRIIGKENIAVEPKLDGIRCFAVVENATAVLYARSGKVISNFDSTIGKELSELPDGCYDGEIMGKDFIALMRQAYRKDNVVTDEAYLALFDYLPMSEWKTHQTYMSCEERYRELIIRVRGIDIDLIAPEISLHHSPKFLQVVERFYCVPDYKQIKTLHDKFVASGYEGAMIKDLDAPYKFGRGYEVMKLKEFFDVDLKIEKLLEGTGRLLGMLGAVQVNLDGVEVQVGSGFSDELRKTIWNNPEKFVGRTVEIRYQEKTPDGSLRFPTFVCFRNDRD